MSSTTPKAMNGTEDWPTCLNCGRLCLSDGTCLSKRCMQQRLDEALNKAPWQAKVASCGEKRAA